MLAKTVVQVKRHSHPLQPYFLYIFNKIKKTKMSGKNKEISEMGADKET